ncbi:hypothetical protein ACIHFE_25430 [Streptomyces sp. NPDC052396]|uniref:hypothetical protein n=1 Tax=Streptomyces sp. NPDC052396 TaxID=3365689 RepID=UPI0037D93B57
MEAVRNMVPDRETAMTLAAKMVKWGNTELSEKEQGMLVDLVWRHADPHDHIRVRNFDALDDDEETFVTELESEFRRSE